MKFFLVLIFFPVILNAQQIEPGFWVKTKEQKIDGTEVFNVNNFVEYRLSQKPGLQR